MDVTKQKMNRKEGWALKNWLLQTVVLEKTLESPLDCKKTKPVHPKGNQSWIFIGSTDAEAEAPILWSPDARTDSLTGKDFDAGQDWRQEEEATEDEMIGWHHQLSGHEFEEILGESEGQGSLVCCSPWGHKELDTTKQLNNHHKTDGFYIVVPDSEPQLASGLVFAKQLNNNNRLNQGWKSEIRTMRSLCFCVGDVQYYQN